MLSAEVDAPQLAQKATTGRETSLLQSSCAEIDARLGLASKSELDTLARAYLPRATLDRPTGRHAAGPEGGRGGPE